MHLPKALILLPLLPAASFAATFCFEAEHANALSMPFEITEPKEGPGSRVLTIPEGAGDSTAFRGARNGIRPGTATYRVPFLAGKKWWVWLRVRWNGNCSNSMIVRIGNRSEIIMTERFGVWHWIKIDKPFSVESRLTSVFLQSREDGIWVDQVLLTDTWRRRVRGPQATNLMPGNPENKHSEPVFFLGSDSAGLAAVPPTDYRLSHRGHEPVSLPQTRRYVLRAGKSTAISVWLRNNALIESKGKAVLETTAPVKVKQGLEQEFSIRHGQALHKLVFDVTPDSPAPGREYAAYVRVRYGNGRILGRKLILHYPFTWLVTNHMPCREGTGVETPCALETRRDRGFPGTPAGISWRVAGHDSITPFGLLDMRRAVADKNYVMAYAYTCFDGDADGDYMLDVRHDDAIRIWLNGSHAFTSLKHRPSVQTRQLVTVPLKKGPNHLLVKLCQRKNYWEFGTVFLTADGRPAPVRGHNLEATTGDTEGVGLGFGP